MRILFAVNTFTDYILNDQQETLKAKMKSKKKNKQVIVSDSDDSSEEVNCLKQCPFQFC